MSFNKKVCLLVAALVLLNLSGCAFGTRKSTLRYTAVTPVKAPNNIQIKVAAFDDNRPDKNIIGNVRNGLGMKTADVVTDTNISSWTADALKTELKNAGYSIVEGDSQSEISGEVIKVYCDSYLNYEGEVIIKVTLKKDNNVLFTETYSGKASDLNWACTAKSYGVMLERSLQKALNQVVTDVEKSLK